MNTFEKLENPKTKKKRSKKIQHLEPLFSKSLKANGEFYYMKLQFNPLAHTRTPADYFVMSKDGTVRFIECKECNLNANTKGRYVFDRLTQYDMLYNFHNFSNKCNAYVCIMVWNKRIKDSTIYLIPISSYAKVEHHYINWKNKKSMRPDQIEKEFSAFKLTIHENLIEFPF